MDVQEGWASKLGASSFVCTILRCLLSSMLKMRKQEPTREDVEDFVEQADVSDPHYIENLCSFHDRGFKGESSNHVREQVIPHIRDIPRKKPKYYLYISVSEHATPMVAVRFEMTKPSNSNWKSQLVEAEDVLHRFPSETVMELVHSLPRIEQVKCFI
ncbi:hypothetical protein BT96DRAFT_929886 [Gymnopus androsaceus JB14]|uniref:Uncharacterized protein n=1 Tax=Gymnopus androsaceus JB14 TaxID=1447944 RepID=A0A6A4GCS6_9AGAR|nr:hypothetical protein BT96DRAFT_929886 [Gymnopus androsaceus JB14]